MNNKTGSKSKIAMLAIMLAVVFITFNVVLFLICGFSGHTATFWASYAFINLAFVVVLITAGSIKNRTHQPKDIILGFPILRHSAIYFVLEFIAAIIFMLLEDDCAWGVALSVQLIILAIHIVFITLCFVARATVIEVENKVAASTAFMKMLQVDVEMIAEKATDAEVKQAYRKLAEDVRYSDPVSNASLAHLEGELAGKIKSGNDAVTAGDNAAALAICNAASLLLIERNKKTKALK